MLRETREVGIFEESTYIWPKGILTFGKINFYIWKLGPPSR